MVKENIIAWHICAVLAILLVLSISTKGFFGCPYDSFVNDSDSVNTYEDKLRDALKNIERVEVSIDDDEVKGNIEAPVTLVEFSDYECPACYKFFKTVYSKIDNDYIRTGKIRYVLRDFPLSMHKNALEAANAAECASEQGRFWEMHDKLFDNQKNLDISSLKSYAGNLGLDTRLFNDCIDSKKFNYEIQNDILDGTSYGVRATPTVFVNGIKLEGPSYEAIKTIIDLELEEGVLNENN